MSRLDDTHIVAATKGVWWGYEPVPPFKVQRFHVLGYPALSVWSNPVETLDEAMRLVAMQFLPIETGFCIEVVDDNWTGVFGLSKLTGLADMLGHAWGVGAAFEAAERLGDIDQVSLAIWEMNARKTAPGG